MTPNHPGQTLQAVLAKHGLSQRDLCRATGYSAKHINRVIKGREIHSFSPELALSLEEALGPYGAPGEYSAEYWCSLQIRWDLARLRERTK